jgi:hypothetical protein
VHPSALTTALLRAGPVREYQVRQTARGADITVVTDPGLDDAALAAAVEQSLRQPASPSRASRSATSRRSPVIGAPARPGGSSLPVLAA